MSLYLEFDRIVRALARANVRYAVAGGFAVGLHGYVRATQDMDFLVHPDDVPATTATLRRLLYRANPVTQEFARAGLTLQRFFKGMPKAEDVMIVDVLVPTSTRMKNVLNRVVRVPFSTISLPVVNARDLVVMKRLRGSARDKADIEFLRKRR